MNRLIVFSIAAVVIVLSVWKPHLMINPGELSEGHQKIKNECTACHRPLWGIETSRCISCHKLEEIGMKDSSAPGADAKVILFHSKLKNTECTACHTDHKGIHPQSSLMHFEHELLPMETKNNCNSCHGKPSDQLHEQLSVSCSSCHNTNSWKLTGSFNHDMITGINKANCSACHQKPSDSFHQSLKNNCDKCHSTSQWKPSTFDHSSYFILDNHHNAKCSTCHLDNSFSAYTCYGCHEHSEARVISKHSEEGILNISDCASCHRSGDEHDIRSRGERNNELNSKDVQQIKDFVKPGKKNGDGHDKGEEDD